MELLGVDQSPAPSAVLQNKRKELMNDKRKNKQLLALEWPLGLAGIIELLVLIVPAAYIIEENPIIAAIIIVTSIIVFIIIACVMLRLEQLAGYYKCKVCGTKYTHKYSTVLWGMHFGRTRYLPCKKCKKKTWQKKVL